MRMKGFRFAAAGTARGAYIGCRAGCAWRRGRKWRRVRMASKFENLTYLGRCSGDGAQGIEVNAGGETL
jgi:hypothetical protein